MVAVAAHAAVLAALVLAVRAPLTVAAVAGQVVGLA